MLNFLPIRQARFQDDESKNNEQNKPKIKGKQKTIKKQNNYAILLTKVRFQKRQKNKNCLP